MSIKKILKEYDNFDWINDINPISPHIENIVGKKLRHRDNNLAHIANHNDLSKIKDGGVLLLKPKMDYYFVVDRIDRITNEGIIKIFPKRKSRYKQEEVRYSVSDMENLIRLGVWVLDDSIEESDNTIVEESGEEIEPIEKEIDYIEKEYGWLTGETKFDTMTSGITNKDVFKAKYILTNEIKKNNSFVYLYKNFLEFLNKVNTILGTDIKIKEDTFTTMTGRNSENTKDVYGLSDEQIKKWKEVKRNNARVVGQKNLRQPKTQEEIDTNLTKLIDYLTEEERKAEDLQRARSLEEWKASQTSGSFNRRPPKSIRPLEGPAALVPVGRKLSAEVRRKVVGCLSMAQKDYDLLEEQIEAMLGVSSVIEFVEASRAIRGELKEPRTTIEFIEFIDVLEDEVLEIFFTEQ